MYDFKQDINDDNIKVLYDGIKEWNDNGVVGEGEFRSLVDKVSEQLNMPYPTTMIVVRDAILWHIANEVYG